MARYQPGYVYPQGRRGPRWPLLFAALIVVALVAAGAVLVAGGGLDVSVDDIDPREQEVAQAPTEAGAPLAQGDDGDEGGIGRILGSCVESRRTGRLFGQRERCYHLPPLERSTRS